MTHTMNGHTTVYDAGRQGYVAMDTDGQWWAWPAVEDGWKDRQKAPATAADDLPELPDGRLALRLSGWEG